MEDSLHGSTLPGIALMVALAKYFRAQGSWAKDVIFLITEHELVGFQAWLDAYHDVRTAPGVIDPGMLKARSGPIQAAINLELHSSRIKRLDLKLVGLNGQLPNLDLFNLEREEVELGFRATRTSCVVGREPSSLNREASMLRDSLFVRATRDQPGFDLPARSHLQRPSFQAAFLTPTAL
ncbi:hypothetical protein HPB50_014607 [Hyalomma asiaticum]|uniref:Uncharacterized protein n=1 Tax=Hyalomma asiaticum TaxID=266040 RepID=A0ACB7THZ9_HYAAI|nr:hypothetical protein HPB50_014607 [Hyalomma asiaticum]